MIIKFMYILFYITLVLGSVYFTKFLLKKLSIEMLMLLHLKLRCSLVQRHQYLYYQELAGKQNQKDVPIEHP